MYTHTHMNIVWGKWWTVCLKKFMVGNPQLTVDVEVEEDFDESEVEMEEDFEADGKNDSKDD